MKDKHVKDVKFLQVEESYSLSGAWTDKEITDAVTKVVNILGEKYDKSVMFAFLKEALWYGTDKITIKIEQKNNLHGYEADGELQYSVMVKTVRPGILNAEVVQFPTGFFIAARPASGELSPKERSKVTLPVLSGLTYRQIGTLVELSNFFQCLKPGAKFYEASGDLVFSHFDSSDYEYTPHPGDGKSKWNYIAVGYSDAPFVYGVAVVFGGIRPPETIRE